eukprot:2338233-Pyramimonas_sp.AAC.1
MSASVPESNSDSAVCPAEPARVVATLWAGQPVVLIKLPCASVPMKDVGAMAAATCTTDVAGGSLSKMGMRPQAL